MVLGPKQAAQFGPARSKKTVFLVVEPFFARIKVAMIDVHKASMLAIGHLCGKECSCIAAMLDKIYHG